VVKIKFKKKKKIKEYKAKWRMQPNGQYSLCNVTFKMALKRQFQGFLEKKN